MPEVNHFMRSKLRCLSSFEFRSKVKFQFRVIRDFHIEQKFGRREEDVIAVFVGYHVRSLDALEFNQFCFVVTNDPTGFVVWLGLEFALGSVLVLQSVLDDFKLKFTDGADNFAVAKRSNEKLSDPFIGQLLNALFQLLALHRIFVDQFFEDFRRKTGDAAKDHVFAFGQRVTNFEGAGVVQADDIARPRFIHDIFVLGEEGGGIGKLHSLVEPGVLVKRIALELPAADAHEGDAVAVPRINVGVNLENKPGELGLGGGHLTHVR